MAAPLILIVDDNENNRKLARDVLEFAGFGTLEAPAASRAWPSRRSTAPTSS